MANFYPSTTIYLCAGTGLDMQHSVWMHQYAYATEDYRTVSWWNTLFQWFKCHSIAEGYWYYTYTDPSRGYVDVGRTPLSEGSKGQSGLGSAEKQKELDTDRVDYSEAIADIDWIVFANGDEGGIYDTKYGMVERIEWLNPNTARIYFIIDALLTYQKYFELGRSFIARDMEYNEWENHGNGTSEKFRAKNLGRVNTQPESVGVNESDYIIQHLIGNDDNAETLEWLNLGSYKYAMCVSDIDLENINTSITSNLFPNFKPCTSTKLGECDLGIGVYIVRNRVNKYFEKLGEFNAFDHILMSYTIPEKFVRDGYKTGDDLYGLKSDAQYMIADEYNGKTAKYIKIPNHFNNDSEISLAEKTGDFRPLNLKCYRAPLSYISISDKQGSSIELVPENIIPQLSETEDYFYQLLLKINATVAPNFTTYLEITNVRNAIGSPERPFQTLFQIPTYQMTPNNSGSGLAFSQFAATVGTTLVVMAVTGTLGVAALGAGTTIGSGGALTLAGAKGVMATGAAKMFASGGGAVAAGGGALAGKVTESGLNAASSLVQGLPKTNGGTPTGMTTFTVNNAGYEIFFCHVRTELLKIADYSFSVTGYAQNCFRRPHINTRKRWCYVKLSSVNISNIGGNNYIMGGTPFWARQQIEERLKNGVTFWNLRHAVGDSVVDSYTEIPQDAINMNFVRNYGKSVDDEIIRDNTDHCDDYAADYNEEA